MVFLLRIMFTVYMHICPNNKVYIGITSQKPNERWINGKGYQNNIHFYRAIQKYGWDNIKHEIIAENLTAEQAQKLEIELIEKYQSFNPDKGYNKSIGGQFGMYGVKHSEETKQKIGNSVKGEKHYLFGKHLSKETRRKMSISRTGHTVSENTRKKISERHKGKKMPIEAITKMANSKRGKPASKITLQKAAEKNRKPIICLENKKIYISIKEAGKQLCIDSRRISEVCSGKRKMVSNLHFRYLTEQEKCQFLQSKTN